MRKRPSWGIVGAAVLAAAVLAAAGLASAATVLAAVSPGSATLTIAAG
jgi:hypothetical protein